MARAKGDGINKPKVKGTWGHLVGVLPLLNTRTERHQEQDALRLEIIAEYQREETVANLRLAGKYPTAEAAEAAIDSGAEKLLELFPPTSKLVEQYLALRDAKDAITAQLSGVQLELDTLTNMIEQRYIDEDILKVQTSDGSSVGMHYEPYAQVVDNDALREWAVKNGLERKLALPWSTVNSEMKAALDSGTAVYDGEKLVGGPDGVTAYMVTKFQKRGGA